jgi:hypothetical protein
MTTFHLLGSVPDDIRDETLGLAYMGPRVIQRLDAPADVETVLRWFKDRFGQISRGELGAPESDEEKAYSSTIIEASLKLLNATPPDQAPELAMDAVLALGADRYPSSRPEGAPAVASLLNNSSERRHLMFWRTADYATRHPALRRERATNTYQLEMAGWRYEAQAEDLRWLLVDVATRKDPDQRLLALDASIRIWVSCDRPDKMLDDIRHAASAFSDTVQAFNNYVAPRQTSPEELDREKEWARLQAQRDAQTQQRDQSWIAFIDEIRTAPDELDRLDPIKGDGVEPRLFSLWQLLSWTNGDSRYAIDDIGGIAPILGEDAAEALRRALIRFWRRWKPTLKSVRAAGAKNMVQMIDCMALVAISLEAKGNAAWASSLSPSDAYLAAEFATLELNGFPAWVEQLAAHHPREVGAIFLQEIIDELEAPTHTHGVLDKTAYAVPIIAKTTVSGLIDALVARPLLAGERLAATLDAIMRGNPDPADAARLLDLLLARFGNSGDGDANYIGVAFQLDAARAVSALTARLDHLQPADQTSLVQQVLPKIYGDRWFRSLDRAVNLPVPELERLIHIAYQAIRPEEDMDRPSGKVYSPESRDHAQGSRDAAYGRLANTPGPEAVAALRRIAAAGGPPNSEQSFRRIIRRRAEQDSELDAWPAGEAFALEQEFDRAPASPADLQKVAMRRLSDIQHALHNEDFAQGETFKRLPVEADVQIWVADVLRNRQGRAYSVEREPEVVAKKAPDIRLRARTSDASLPIEIKVVESWTIPQLEFALTKQLGGRYLRGSEANYGVLLLVHQKARPQGWKEASGRMLTFPEVVHHLRGIADQEASRSVGSPKAQVAVIDVSSIVLPNTPPDRISGIKSVLGR